MKIWMVDIEDEHGYYGCTISKPCSDKESAQYWLFDYLKNGGTCPHYLIGKIFVDFKDFETDIWEWETAIQNEYSSWEYGGRYYISISEREVYTK